MQMCKKFQRCRFLMTKFSLSLTGARSYCRVSFVQDFCNYRHVLETVKVALKRRAGSRQLQLFLIVLVYVTVVGPLQGETAG